MKFFFSFVPLACALASCATVPPDAGIADTHASVAARLSTSPSTVGAAEASNESEERHRIVELLSKPLTRDSAVTLALLHSPRVRAEYARLGIARADVIAASRIANPTLSIGVLHARRGERDKVEASIGVAFADLLLLPAKNRMAAAEFERARDDVAAAIVAFAAETEADWFRCVGAQHVASMREAASEAASASAELASRYIAAGNISALQLASEQAAASIARIAAARAKAEATTARFALASRLGIAGDDTPWTIDARLPPPLASDESAEALQALAKDNRLDVASAKRRVATLEEGARLARRFRFVGDIELGARGERETDGERLGGPELTLRLPIFEQGQAAIARADAQLARANAALDEIELAAENERRAAIAHVASARAIAEEFRVALVPQREAALARTQERADFMLVGAFELILAKQQEFDAYQGYLEAVRDYWLARVELARAVGTRLPGDAHADDARLGVDDTLAPTKSSTHEHDSHDHGDAR